MASIWAANWRIAIAAAVVAIPETTATSRSSVAFIVALPGKLASTIPSATKPTNGPPQACRLPAIGLASWRMQADRDVAAVQLLAMVSVRKSENRQRRHGKATFWLFHHTREGALSIRNCPGGRIAGSGGAADSTTE
jgi:hypothetical protein